MVQKKDEEQKNVSNENSNSEEVSSNENQPEEFVLGGYGKPDEIDLTDVYDEGDIASAIEMGFLAQALANHKEKVAPETHPDFDGETCVSCGNEMPPERLKMGRIRCVECQTQIERKSKLYG